MGGEQAATVMSIVTEQKQKRRGTPVDSENIAAMHKDIVNRFDAESNVLFATARIWDDGIIDPRDTRRVLQTCLELFREADLRQLNPSSFGVARM
jgi:geranyl-CoA carboxylase beta subunit